MPLMLASCRSHRVLDLVNRKVFRVGHDVVGRYGRARTDISIGGNYAGLGPENDPEGDNGGNSRKTKVSSHVRLHCDGPRGIAGGTSCVRKATKLCTKLV